MKKNYLIFLIVFFINVILLTLLFPKADPLLLNNEEEIKCENITIFAIGDSLTQGVGDENGGYTFYLKNNLEGNLNIENVQIYNYGVSGNTSNQIINRIDNDEDLKSDLESADIITITVGGNDLMKIFKDNILSGIGENTFTKPTTDYILNLDKLYSKLREQNSSAVIYHLGIYNPFSAIFENLEGLQKVVDDWNTESEKFVNKQNNAYYVSIDEYFYYDDLSSDTSPYLSKDDNFHPNSLGYEVISKEFEKKITEYIRGEENAK